MPGSGWLGFGGVESACFVFRVCFGVSRSALVVSVRRGFRVFSGRGGCVGRVRRGGCGVPGRSWLLRLGQPLAILLLSRPSRLFLEGQAASSRVTVSNNRSVMPLDVLGRTRATLTHAASLPCPKGPGNLVNVCRDRDRLLQLLILNEEFLVNASHQLALITSLPFVHTARRYYRLNGLVRSWDWLRGAGNGTLLLRT